MTDREVGGRQTPTPNQAGRKRAWSGAGSFDGGPPDLVHDAHTGKRSVAFASMLLRAVDVRKVSGLSRYTQLIMSFAMSLAMQASFKHQSGRH